MKDNYHAIKYYSNNDLSIGHSLEQSEKLINLFDSSKEYTDVNEVIELYNVQELLDSGVILQKWDSDTVDSLKSTCRQFTEIISRFFNGITDGAVSPIISSLNPIYAEDFWTLFSKYKLYSRVHGSTIIELIESGDAYLWQVLEHKDIVSHYNKELASYMRTSDQSAELLLISFLAEGNDKLFFPNDLLKTEYESIFEAYIATDSPNPNFLKLIVISQGSDACPISTKLRQKAKHRYLEIEEQLFSDRIGVAVEVSVGFNDIDAYMTREESDSSLSLVYDSKWITENLDFPTLLNNFRYVIEQVDFCCRSTLVSSPYKLETLERSFGIKGKKEYQTGIQFRILDLISQGQIRGYRHLLSRNGIELESVFQWFFTDYLRDEFHAPGFHFNASSKGSSIVERVKNLASEMDGVLKQFRAFLEDGYIDQELFEMNSEHVAFSQLKSFFPNKYAYPNSSEVKAEMNALFSDQSLLAYTEKTGSRYKEFGELIENEHLKVNDFEQFQVGSIRWLLSRGTICEDSDQYLRIRKDRLIVLKDLFIHDVICPMYAGDYKLTIDKLVASGDLRYGNTLFSEPEQKYLNYMLNKSAYDNGHDLRNKYIHGTYSRDSRIQEMDYDHLLLIMALVVMKINEEFCLRYPLE